ncbi:hypothetical protein [Marinobacter salsuginis]|uniref:Uncharacterized protein n=1 Tax=Marinobacter salsuginis TaxID=418719 RepID=A0A5M3Q4W9_9GAMM|nr:hypothetical protein [Marinobacter salsuginis]GBO90197.1 hypothetical protein MSSD14B_38650 [Marinobacter salsuginis]
MAESLQEQDGVCVVAYPQEYVIGQDVDDYVIASDPSGGLIKVSMPSTAVMDELRSKYDVDHTPSIARFADTRDSNPMACQHAPDNGPDNPQGQILFQQSFLVGYEDDMPHFRAGWGSVICKNAQNLAPEFGLGYMEIDYKRHMLSPTEKSELTQLEQSYKAINRKLFAAGDSPSGKKLQEELKTVARRIDDLTDPAFRAVMLHPEETVSMPLSGIKNIERAMEHAVDRYSHQGRLGGFILRVTDEGGRIVPGLSGEGYAWRKGNATQEAKEVSQGYLYAMDRGRLLKQYQGQGYTVDIVPTQRISCGPGGNNTYSRPAQIDTLRKMYMDKRTGATLAYPMALRLATTRDFQNHLLARAYPVGPAMGHPMQVDPEGSFSYPLKLDGADLSLADQYKNMRTNREYSTDMELLVEGESYRVRDSRGSEFTATCESINGQNQLVVNGFALPEGFEFSPQSGRFEKKPEQAQSAEMKAAP